MVDRARLGKLLGMLGSSFDGERANAAAMIAKMAADEKVTIADMCLGKQSEGSGRSAADFWKRQYDTMRADKEKLQKVVNALKDQIAAAARKGGSSGKYDFNNSRAQSANDDLDPNEGEELLTLAKRMRDEPHPAFTKWELDFLENVSGWASGRYLSVKQRDTIRKIYSKAAA